MHRLQTIPHIWKRTLHDHTHRIIDEGFAHLVFNQTRTDVLRYLIAHGRPGNEELRHGPKRACRRLLEIHRRRSICACRNREPRPRNLPRFGPVGQIMGLCETSWILGRVSTPGDGAMRWREARSPLHGGFSGDQGWHLPCHSTAILVRNPRSAPRASQLWSGSVFQRKWKRMKEAKKRRRGRWYLYSLLAGLACAPLGAEAQSGPPASDRGPAAGQERPRQEPDKRAPAEPERPSLRRRPTAPPPPPPPRKPSEAPQSERRRSGD